MGIAAVSHGSLTAAVGIIHRDCSCKRAPVTVPAPSLVLINRCMLDVTRFLGGALPRGSAMREEAGVLAPSGAPSAPGWSSLLQ